ncbi:hypothetical protein BaRGS_00034492, partial [Batillaria attramentaria]
MVMGGKKKIDTNSDSGTTQVISDITENAAGMDFKLASQCNTVFHCLSSRDFPFLPPLYKAFVFVCGLMDGPVMSTATKVRIQDAGQLRRPRFMSLGPKVPRWTVQEGQSIIG